MRRSEGGRGGLAHPDPLGLAVVAVAALPAALVRGGVGQGEAGELDDAEVEVHGDGVGAAGGRRPAGPAVEAHTRIGDGGTLAEGWGGAPCTSPNLAGNCDRRRVSTEGVGFNHGKQL